MKKLLILLSVMLLVYGCGQVLPPQSASTTTGTLTGVVTKTDGNPLDGVTVSAGGSSATTNSSGWFAIGGLSASSRLTITYSKTGYISSQRITSLSSGASNHVTISLLAQAAAQSLTVSTGGTVTIAGTTGLATFPANAFENADRPSRHTPLPAWMWMIRPA